MMAAVTLTEGPRTIVVTLSQPAIGFPRAPAVRTGRQWCRVLGAVDVLGVERRDELTSANLRELEQQLAGGAP